MLTVFCACTVTVNLYTNEALTETTYVIPGPPLYGSGSGSAAPSPTVRLVHFIIDMLRWYADANLIRLHMYADRAVEPVPNPERTGNDHHRGCRNRRAIRPVRRVWLHRCHSVYRPLHLHGPQRCVIA